MDVHAFLGPIAGVSMDWIVLAGTVLAVTLAGVQGGTSRATALTLALSVTLLLERYVGDAYILSTLSGSLGSSMAQGVLQLGIFVALFIFMYRIVDIVSFDATRFFPSLLAALAATVVLVLVWTQTPALNSLWHFGPQIQSIFGTAYHFWWLMAAYLALAAARG